MARTLVISDLHLGKPGAPDLLRRPAVLDRLCEVLEDVDRLVVLGDGFELRHVSQREAARLAAPVFAQIGDALGEASELVVLAGNHDHGLVARWIDQRLQEEEPGFLGLEHRIAPARAGRLADAVAEAARPARMELAYPGVWLRDDVYAIHGHYADVHSTVPTFERIAAGSMARLTRLSRDARPDDYEAALSPLYAFLHQLAERAGHTAVTQSNAASSRAWVALAGDGRRHRPVRAAGLTAAYTAAIGALNLAGLGPFERDISGPALRRGYLHGFREVLARLDVAAPYVIWGHSHRAGPFPRDDPGEWRTHAGGRILNTGSWVHEPHFLGPAPGDSPYFPGTGVLVEDDEAPRVVRLLDPREPLPA